MATERHERVAELIKKGASPAEAMVDAGYGEKFARGHAANYPGVLRKQGLLTDAQAAKAEGKGQVEKAEADAERQRNAKGGK